MKIDDNLIVIRVGVQFVLKVYSEKNRKGGIEIKVAYTDDRDLACNYPTDAAAMEDLHVLRDLLGIKDAAVEHPNSWAIESAWKWAATRYGKTHNNAERAFLCGMLYESRKNISEKELTDYILDI